jgi:hypothetical protein
MWLDNVLSFDFLRDGEAPPLSNNLSLNSKILLIAYA